MGRTIAEALMLVFPNGTNPDLSTNTAALDEPPDIDNRWQRIPAFAADVFAFCAYMIQSIGLMGFFEPDPHAPAAFSKDEPLKVVLSEADRADCRQASKNWSKNGVPCAISENLWAIIFQHRAFPLRVEAYQLEHKNSTADSVKAPEWWQAIIRLLIIADETCDGIGHKHYKNGRFKSKDFEVFDFRTKESRFKEEITIEVDEVPGLSFKIRRAEKSVSTLTMAVDKEVICVQPKGRVTGVGCSMRNLSRNLSITGPVGGVRCNWQPLLGRPKVEKRKSLNILLIPMPLKLNAKWFSPCRNEKKLDWNNFEIKQEWLVPEDEFIENIIGIIKKGKDDVGEIHAVIFPEYALKFTIFTEMLEKLFEATEKTLEFIIAGSKGNCDGQEGNHVLTAIWEDNLVGKRDSDRSKYFRLVSQKKHHRWKLDKQQVTTYGLGSSLAPSKQWWERHSIESRELNFFQFREDAVFASLICEDLARNDPCHDIMRSVAPNLVFALLMDGPQLPNRWPARYAGSLADDPGCTVLTLTSYGLIERSNDHRPDSKSHSVGLLRDSNGTTTEIILPPAHQAVLLTLGSEIAHDRTIDGRNTNNASKWYYISQKPIS